MCLARFFTDQLSKGSVEDKSELCPEFLCNLLAVALHKLDPS
jgi:hypothetical protein